MMNPLFTPRDDRIAANDGEYVGAGLRHAVGPTSSGTLRDRWYIAAWSHEVAAGTTLKRTIFGEAIALSRPGDGFVVAGDRSIVERGGIVWMWCGDPSRAEAARIPEVPCVEGSTWALGVTQRDETWDAGDAMSPGRRAATSRLFIRNEVLSPALSLLTGLPQGRRCDRWIDVRWHAPGGVVLQADVAPVGQPRERGVRTWHLQWTTPSIPGRACCFYALSLPPAGPQMRTDSLLGHAQAVHARRAFERLAAWEHVVEAPHETVA